MDKEARTLSISDNGIGMTQEELDNNLGVIARSGSLQFKQEAEKKDEVDIIGQFGVGFYSAFMVSSRVTVDTKAFGSDEAWHWESTGLDGYEITPGAKADRGTTITLYLKEDSEDENYSEFLDQFRLQDLVKKYSDYIRYPIRMEVSHTHVKEGTGVDGKDPEYETHTEVETLNSMTPHLEEGQKRSHRRGDERLLQGEVLRLAGPLKGHPHLHRGSGPPTRPCCSSPPTPPWTTTPGSMRRACSSTPSGVLIMDKCADLLRTASAL